MTTTVSNVTTGDVPDNNSLTWDQIAVGIALYIVTLMTIFGNILVLIAVKVEKKLQTTFNYYIVNLAVTDVAVAVTAMSFKATHTVLGHWPFGEILCGLWIFFDYGMTFVSVFTLILISIDRFWSVAWSISYRNHHTKKRCLISILSVWLLMLVLWIPPCILDRVRYSEPGVCFWDPSLNQELVYIVAAVGHHFPYAILVFCYTYVFKFMHKRSKVSHFTHARKKVGSSANQPISTIACDGETTTALTNQAAATGQSGDATILTSPALACQSTSSTSKYLNIPRKGSNLPCRIYKNSDVSRAGKERKVFVTMAYIVVAYAILWLPFHIVFDISIAAPLLVPTQVWELAFWMTYFNSTINPFLYNFSSPEFRSTFRQIFKKMCF